MDATTDEEYERLLDRLPTELRAVLEPHIREIDEIVADLHMPLSVRAGELRIDYPLIVDEVMMSRLDLQMQTGVSGGWRRDGRIGIPGTLHRISREVNLQNATVMITIRVGRAIIGVAEPLRPLIERAVQRHQGIAVIGPPAGGKTTLLRDMARIMAERLGRGLVIIDTSNEIAGDSDVPHRIIGRARRVIVGNPQLQAEKFARTIANTGPKALLSDEIGYRDDIPIIVQNAPRGVSITATLHGEDMGKVVRSQNLWPLLGIVNGVKVQPSIFPFAVEVVSRGVYRAHADFDASIGALLAGEVPTQGVQTLSCSLTGNRSTRR